ncbi:MAG: LysE family translocator [Hyphomicrobiaceae bacterium]
MSPAILAAFVVTCVLLAVTPGPNMALIISSTLSGGLAGGIATLLGTLTGLAILVAIAALGMTSVMVLMAEWFDVIRWVGALYLVVLGARQLWSWWRTRGLSPAALAAATPASREMSAGGRYLQGLIVSLSNPKVLLFLGAFFPQFVDPELAPGPQLAVLAVLFVVVLTTVDISYTFAIARARARIDLARLRMLDVLSGVLLVAGGLVLASARRP